VFRKHTGFAPAMTRRGNSFAFPLPTVASIPSRLPASPSRACALRPRGHTPSAPPTDLWQATNQQSLLGFRLRSPLPSVEEPCPLSLQTVFSITQPDLLPTPSVSLEERTQKANPLWSLRLFPKTYVSNRKNIISIFERENLVLKKGLI